MADALAVDVAVVGGSFAGLSAAMQVARTRRRVCVIDAGMPRNRFAAHSHGFLGQDGRAPAEIMRDARGQLLAYPTAAVIEDVAIDAAARAVEGGDAFVLALGSGARIEARRLVLATGVVDHLPDVPGLAERWGRTALHCPYCHGYEIGGGRIGVIATSAMSIHQALLVADWGDVVMFTRNAVEPDADQHAALARRGVAIEPVPVTAVTTVDDGEAVLLADGRAVRVAALFVAPRTEPASDLAVRLGCAFDEGPLGPVVRVDTRQATTVPGVFAAGDAATPLHNATLASASGVLAGVFAHQSIAVPG